MTSRTDSSGRTHQVQGFHFHGATCGKCRLRSAGVAAGRGKGRTVTLHPQEALLQQARALQKTEAFARYRQRRQVVEHRLARLVQLGIRQSRYFGRAKTLFQVVLAATVANLTLVATGMGMMKAAGRHFPYAPFFFGLAPFHDFQGASKTSLSNDLIFSAPHRLAQIQSVKISAFRLGF